MRGIHDQFRQVQLNGRPPEPCPGRGGDQNTQKGLIGLGLSEIVHPRLAHTSPKKSTGLTRDFEQLHDEPIPAEMSVWANPA